MSDNVDYMANKYSDNKIIELTDTIKSMKEYIDKIKQELEVSREINNKLMKSLNEKRAQYNSLMESMKF